MKSILIVGGQATSRELVRVGLEHAGYAVREAPNSAEALESADLPDLIVLDWQVPGLSAAEAIGQFHGDTRLKHVPIMALTAGALQADHERAIEAGFSSCLSKPVHLNKLRKEVERLLR
jgi:two-component system phosphate regulon response regulator PhoB